MTTQEKNDETMKVVEEQETSEGRRLVTLNKGTKKTTRLEHEAPSWMISEE